MPFGIVQKLVGQFPNLFVWGITLVVAMVHLGMDQNDKGAFADQYLPV